VESKLGPLGTAAIYCPIVPAPGDCEDGELFGGRIFQLVLMVVSKSEVKLILIGNNKDETKYFKYNSRYFHKCS
jgi:hypothetical protein